jgi:hypothetical protein
MSSWLRTRMDGLFSEQRKTPPSATISLRSPLELAAFVTSLIPYIWTLGIITLAVRARLYLGHWPRPSHPDPKHLPFEFHHEILWDVFEGIKWSIVIVQALYAASRIFWKQKLWRLPLRIYLIGWLVIAVMIFVPHFDFVMWFMD